eukprot:scaffold3777_cov335-Prasinococcus_capsulatus_cf.AAC.5
MARRKHRELAGDGGVRVPTEPEAIMTPISTEPKPKVSVIQRSPAAAPSPAPPSVPENRTPRCLHRRPPRRAPPDGGCLRQCGAGAWGAGGVRAPLAADDVNGLRHGPRARRWPGRKWQAMRRRRADAGTWSWTSSGGRASRPAPSGPADAGPPHGPAGDAAVRTSRAPCAPVERERGMPCWRCSCCCGRVPLAVGAGGGEKARARSQALSPADDAKGHRMREPSVGSVRE